MLLPPFGWGGEGSSECERLSLSLSLSLSLFLSLSLAPRGSGKKRSFKGEAYNIRWRFGRKSISEKAEASDDTMMLKKKIGSVGTKGEVIFHPFQELGPPPPPHPLIALPLSALLNSHSLSNRRRRRRIIQDPSPPQSLSQERRGGGGGLFPPSPIPLPSFHAFFQFFATGEKQPSFWHLLITIFCFPTNNNWFPI